jgi:hypothetical protein
MDGTRTMTEIRKTFRTPLRILVPKLLKSRDDWKAKSDTRKAKLRAAKVTIRDLTTSRELWRQRAETFAHDNQQLREQLQLAQRQRDAALAANNDSEKK